MPGDNRQATNRKVVVVAVVHSNLVLKPRRYKIKERLLPELSTTQLKEHESIRTTFCAFFSLSNAALTIILSSAVVSSISAFTICGSASLSREPAITKIQTTRHITFHLSVIPLNLTTVTRFFLDQLSVSAAN